MTTVERSFAPTGQTRENRGGDVGRTLPVEVGRHRADPAKAIWMIIGPVLSGDHMLYHMVMARREVLVQLDDDLVDRLDSLASALGTNRSELLRRGAQAVIDAEQIATADRELQIAYRRQPADPALVRSARRLAAETAPAW